MTALSELGGWMASISDDHDPRAYTAARTALIDTAACILGGTSEEVTNFARKSVLRWPGGICHAVGGIRIAAPHAALINGTAAHALDFDDNDKPGATHPSAVIYPSLLALAEERNKSGRAVLDAYIVAIEVIGRIGEAVNMAHYAMGWHATATLGTIGAAAGCARLLGLDMQQSAAAISLAVSRAAGFKSQFGTSAKPLHAGLSAQSAIIAASLAEAGASGSPDVLDGKWSILTLQSDASAAGFRSLQSRLGNPLAILEYGISYKQYPCCYYIARAVDGALSLRQKHSLAPDDIASVKVEMPERNASILPFLQPKSQNEARFSVPYCVGTALLKGRLRLEEMSEAFVRGADVQSYLRRVTLEPYPGDPNAPDLSPDQPDIVTVTLKSGRSLSETVRVIHGSADDPMSNSEMEAKFLDCARFTLNASAAQDLLDMLTAFETADDIRKIMELLP